MSLSLMMNPRAWRSADYRQDVVLAQDQVISAVDRDTDLGSAVLGEQHSIAGLDVERDPRAFLVACALTDRDHDCLDGLLLGVVGDDEATRRLALGVDALDEDAIVEGADA